MTSDVKQFWKTVKCRNKAHTPKLSVRIALIPSQIVRKPKCLIVSLEDAIIIHSRL